MDGDLFPLATHRDVVVVSGSYGAGHDAAAAELARRLRATGTTVRLLDVAVLLPFRIGLLLRWAYLAQLRIAPGTWETTVRHLQHDGWTTRTIQYLLGVLGRRLVRAVAGADLVVSTHPFASQALGAARASRRLLSPVATYLTDASVHRLWVHPSVDVHLAIHEVAAAQCRAIGGAARVVAPLVPQAPVIGLPAPALPWPTGATTALIVGGSCGIGRLEQAAHDVLATGVMTPVVACGSNQALRLRVEAIPGAVALGWRQDLRTLMASADCVLQNAGGMSSLESLACGTPTFTYLPIPGHGLTNALALAQAGLVPWLADVPDLGAALAAVLGGARGAALPCGDDAATALEAMLPTPALAAAA
ncbi:MAG: galactosyldiacylglycerol synthase [Nocardioides sp.]